MVSREDALACAAAAGPPPSTWLIGAPLTWFEIHGPSIEAAYQRARSCGASELVFRLFIRRNTQDRAAFENSWRGGLHCARSGVECLLSTARDSAPTERNQDNVANFKSATNRQPPLTYTRIYVVNDLYLSRGETELSLCEPMDLRQIKALQDEPGVCFRTAELVVSPGSGGREPHVRVHGHR